jgi:hypothetical protein
MQPGESYIVGMLASCCLWEAFISRVCLGEDRNAENSFFFFNSKVKIKKKKIKCGC